MDQHDSKRKGKKCKKDVRKLKSNFPIDRLVAGALADKIKSKLKEPNEREYVFYQLPDDDSSEDDPVQQVNLGKIEEEINQELTRAERTRPVYAKKARALSFHLFVLRPLFINFDDYESIIEVLSKIQQAVKAISAIVSMGHRAKNENHLLRGPFKLPKRSPLQLNVSNLQHICEVIFFNILCDSGEDGTQKCWLVKGERRFVFSGQYLITFAALELNDNIGPPATVFAIYKRPKFDVVGQHKSLRDTLSVSPTATLAAGYAIYGVTTTLMFASKYGSTGSHQFILDQESKQFLKVHGEVKIPVYGLYYSVNEGAASRFTPSIAKLIKNIKNRAMVILSKKSKDLQRRSVRYTGFLLTDLHFIVKRGGIAMDPSYTNLPTGRLSMVFKCNPLAFFISKANGLAINDHQSFNDVVVESPFLKSAMYAGSIHMVKKLYEIQKAQAIHDKFVTSEFYSQ